MCITANSSKLSSKIVAVAHQMSPLTLTQFAQFSWWHLKSMKKMSAEEQYFYC